MLIKSSNKINMTTERKKRGSLANKIMAMMMGVNLLLVILLFSFFILRFQRITENNQDVIGDTLISSLAMGSELGVISNDPIFLEKIFKYLMEKKHVIFVAAYSADGKILLQGTKDHINLSIPKERFDDYLSRRKPFVGKEHSIPHGIINDYFAPIITTESDPFEYDVTENGETLTEKPRGKAIGLVRLGLSVAEVSTAMRQIIFFTGAISIAILLAGALLTLFISRRITRPLAQLEAGAKRISAGELDFEISVTSDDEVVRLADAFNSMSHALKKSTVSRAYLDNILESMIDTMIVVDLNGCIQTANRALSELTGYPRDELIGMPFENLLDDDADNSILEDGVDGLIKRETVHDNELYYITKDGEKIPMSFSGSVMRDHTETVIGFTCVAQNITLRKATESELKRRMNDIEKFNKFMLGREKRILEVKGEVNDLLKNSGQPPKYSC